MAFLTKFPIQTTSSRQRIVSPKAFPFKVLAVGVAFALIVGLGFYLQFDFETPRQSKPAMAMARNGTDTEKQRLAFL